jgi:CspA family cold shock protein
MKKGTIKVFYNDRGFGFIRPEAGEQEIFFHKNVVRDMGYPLEEGAPVEYEEGPGRKPGERQATRVVILGYPADPAPGERRPAPPRLEVSGRQLPPECIFEKSFYDESGHLHASIFYEAAEAAARAFRAANLKANQLRALFNAFAGFVRPLTEGRLSFEEARERFGIFYCERVVRQFERGVLPPLVKDFFDRHRDLILSSPREMQGFFRYLINIYCYFGDSEKSPQR